MASEKIVRDLYNGKYHVVHNPNARGRAPRYVVNNDKPKGVTTILGQTLAKDLVQWAVDLCLDYLKDKLPFVTKDDLDKAGSQYKFRRDSGASTGSEAHAMVEDLLRGKEVILEEHSEEAVNAYNAFKKWYEDNNPEIVNIEEVIYSAKYKYAGTYDAMLKIDGKNVLCDLKTTNPSRKAPNGIYAEYFIQLGAYALAHEEQREYEEENGGSELVKIEDLAVISAKKDGKLDVVYASDLDLDVATCMGLFKSVINVFAFNLAITERLGGK